MDWSKSQSQLIRLAREQFTGCQLHVVQIHEYGKGLTTALKYSERESRSGRTLPASVVLDGLSKWDCVRSLAKKSGEHVTGCGYFDTIERALLKLSNERKRPVCLWLEEARVMRFSERETVFAHMAYVAEHFDFDLRVFFLIGRVKVWRNKEHQFVSEFPALGSRLVHRATVWDFARKGVTEVDDNKALPIAREPHSFTSPSNVAIG